MFMGQIFEIDEVGRDEELGVVKKKVTATNGSFSFDSPIVTQRTTKFDPDCDKVKINEVIRHIDDEVVTSLSTRGIKPFADKVRDERIDGKLNATIFNFKFNSVPEDSSLKLIAHALNSSSQNIMFLPAVKTSFLQENVRGRKTGVFRLAFTPEKIDEYVQMMRTIIDEAQRFGNGKQIVGTIPLIPFGFAEPIIDLYLSRGIKSFVIDANYKDIMGNEGDFTVILSKINDKIPLNKTVIFACNAGIPHFDADESVSDDFLSVFAYIDIFGCSFKPRGGGGEPRAKIFSRDRYAYNLSTYPVVSRQLGRTMNYVSLRNYNRSEQLKESLKIRNLVGVTKMKKYLETKSAVNEKTIHNLETIAKKVNVP
jgi:hypothetical protein